MDDKTTPDSLSIDEFVAQREAGHADSPDLPEEDEEDFAAMLEESFARMTPPPAPGRMAKGRVVKIDGDHVFIDLGGKSEGVMDISEFRSPEGDVSVKIGDTVEAIVLSRPGEDGGLRMSKAMPKEALSLDMLHDARERGIPVEGKVISRNRGGFEVDVSGRRAFVPMSQIDRHWVEDPDVHVGQTYQFLVKEIREGGRNVVLSRAELLKREAAENAAKLAETLQEGMTLTGTVRNIQKYGAFIDLGGIDGLLPISEMSWGRVNHPSDMLKVGEEVTVRLIRFDKDQNKLTLSLKQLSADPWDEVGIRYREGNTYTGIVRRLESFGAFIELEPGLEGLVHVSNISWEKHIAHPREVLSVGDSVEVQLLEIDPERRRLSLGIKQLSGDPWEGVEERYPVGTSVRGRVEKVAPFGVFVNLEPGVTALIPNSEMNTDRNANHAKDFPPGTDIEASVLAVSPDEKRLTLTRRPQGSVRKARKDTVKIPEIPRRVESKGGLGTLGDVFARLKKNGKSG